MKFNSILIKKKLKLIYQFFLTIYIFESYPRFKKINKKSTSLFFIQSLNQVTINKIIKKYFKKNRFKLNRFKKGSKFIGLKLNNEVVCSGWIYFGKKWKIEEINKKIELQGRYLLFDYRTEKKFRGMGYYKLLLRLIQNKFQKKKLIIYALSHNTKSIKAIEKSGFKLISKIKKY